MHDIDFIRKNPVEFDNLINTRGEKSLSSIIIKIDEEKRNTQTILQNILSERNSISKEIGILKSKNQDSSNLINKVEELKKQISNLKELEKIKEEELNAILTRIPNLASKDVPIGNNEKNNTVYKTWGKKPDFNFTPKRVSLS